MTDARTRGSRASMCRTHVPCILMHVFGGKTTQESHKRSKNQTNCMTPAARYREYCRQTPSIHKKSSPNTKNTTKTQVPEARTRASTVCGGSTGNRKKKKQQTKKQGQKNQGKTAASSSIIIEAYPHASASSPQENTASFSTTPAYHADIYYSQLPRGAQLLL